MRRARGRASAVDQPAGGAGALVGELRREGGELGVGAGALEHRQHQAGRAGLGGRDHLGRDGEELRGRAAPSARCRPSARSSTGTGSSSPGDRDVDGRLEQPGLGAEPELHRRHRHPGRGRDRAHGRARVAALEEQRGGGVDDPATACGAPAPPPSDGAQFTMVVPIVLRCKHAFALRARRRRSTRCTGWSRPSTTACSSIRCCSRCSAPGQPQHVDHLTAFTAESFGGPDRFSRELGFAHLIAVHRGLQDHRGAAAAVRRALPEGPRRRRHARRPGVPRGGARARRVRHAGGEAELATPRPTTSCTRCARCPAGRGRATTDLSVTGKEDLASGQYFRARPRSPILVSDPIERGNIMIRLHRRPPRLIACLVAAAALGSARGRRRRHRRTAGTLAHQRRLGSCSGGDDNVLVDDDEPDGSTTCYQTGITTSCDSQDCVIITDDPRLSHRPTGPARAAGTASAELADALVMTGVGRRSLTRMPRSRRPA